ncbi:TetR/AcrR family transcriptional regulator [Streptomyces mirabilis]|uniref:TetR/AcrR family transcriptional regulator n=1 Tax=Streptomyces mirabilis TaxID=68239 RepID=UPI0036A4035E
MREAASELLAEHGFATTSTRPMTAPAGLSPALVTRHFGSTQGLRAAVDEYVLDRIGEQLRDLGSVQPGRGSMVSLGEVFAPPGSSARIRCRVATCAMSCWRTARRAWNSSAASCPAPVPRRSGCPRSTGGRRPTRSGRLFPMRCLILGPLPLERVMQPNLDEPMFGPEAPARVDVRPRGAGPPQ